MMKFMFKSLWTPNKSPFELVRIERLATLVVKLDFDHIIWYIIETAAVSIIYKKNEDKRQRIERTTRDCLKH